MRYFFLLFLLLPACSPRPAIVLPQTAAPAVVQDSKASGEPAKEAEKAPEIEEPAPPAPSPEELERQHKAHELYLEAHNHYLRGRYDAARELLQKATDLDTKSAEAYILLAKIFIMEGTANNDTLKLEAARQMLGLALESDPGNQESQALLALINKT